MITTIGDMESSSTRRDYVRGWGAEGALAPPEFGGSEKRTERETENLLLLAPPRNQNPNVVLEVRRMRSNLSYLLKSFLLYQQTF